MVINSNKVAMFLIVGFIISFVICVVFAYLWVDQSISNAYSDTSYEKTASLKSLKGLLEEEWLGMSEEALMTKLQIRVNNRPEERIVLFKDEESGLVVFDTLQFRFESGKLKNIFALGLESKLDPRAQ